MYFIYPDNEKRAPWTGRLPPANSAYIRHYGNLMELQRLCKTTEGLYRFQAEKELKKCQEKLDWWSKRPGFSMEAVLPEITRIKRLWDATEEKKQCP